MSAYSVIVCDGKRPDGSRCTNGKSEPAHGRQLAAAPVRAGLKAGGWRAVRVKHITPFIYVNGSAGTHTWTEVKDYCHEHRGQIPSPSDRTVKHPPVELSTWEPFSDTLEEGPAS